MRETLASRRRGESAITEAITVFLVYLLRLAIEQVQWRGVINSLLNHQCFENLEHQPKYTQRALLSGKHLPHDFSLYRLCQRRARPRQTEAAVTLFELSLLSYCTSVL